jgi:two-component system copper resistance phosphate regulon response regulator CusR
MKTSATQTDIRNLQYLTLNCQAEVEYQSTHPPKVLVIEDDHEMISYISRALGHVFDVESRELLDDIDYCAEHPEDLNSVDLIIMDVFLPRRLGVDLAKILRKENLFDTPILFISGSFSGELACKDIKLSNTDFLPKPFKQTELNAKIESLLQKRRGKRAFK